MPRRLQNALTPLFVKNAKPGRYADGGGLYLLVKDGGAKSWLFRATVAGKVRDIGLGSAAPGAISLAKARELAREKAQEVASGAIPVSDRKKRVQAAKAAQAEQAKAKTFKQLAEAFIDLRETGWRNDKHKAQWRSTLETYAYPVFGNLPVSDVTTDHVLDVLRPIWSAKPETASRVRGRIENIMDAARFQGLRTGDNPARWKGHLDFVLPKPNKMARGHHAALPYAELPSFMADLAGREALAAKALQFAILTATRSGEVLGATWAEIDLDAAIWTIPADRMKAAKEHRVPLSARAVEILQEVQGLNTLDMKSAAVFPGNSGGKLSGMAMAMLLRRMERGDITVHGFRSTFREWAGETTAFAREVVEHALAHQLADKAEAAYQRGSLFPKRVKLMQAWADYCTSPLADCSNVTPIRAEA
ncbi:MAG: integrase [Novosphingobium sp. 28-62-57]|uniref:tyrosine-type recombinase/integrase n=1 Tax=Novosphingobium sp. 28-62-57 TaxID=1970409 RepID=UPI000BD742D9|nr:site-specific integrase [Novosphingobium sp. 28-62-57]OYZ08253.1 MAG: integrase [Novosphingobium sp. 28-62-57]